MGISCAQCTSPWGYIHKLSALISAPCESCVIDTTQTYDGLCLIPPRLETTPLTVHHRISVTTTQTAGRTYEHPIHASLDNHSLASTTTSCRKRSRSLFHVLVRQYRSVVFTAAAQRLHSPHMSRNHSAIGSNAYGTLTLDIADARSAVSLPCAASAHSSVDIHLVAGVTVARQRSRKVVNLTTFSAPFKSFAMSTESRGERPAWKRGCTAERVHAGEIGSGEDVCASVKRARTTAVGASRGPVEKT